MTATPHTRPMAELTPRDDNRKRVSEILKRVDQLIKSKEYEQAQRETERAKEIDPRNVYISAYQERLVTLIEQAKKDREQQEIRKKEEEETRKRLEEERKKEEAVRQQKLAEERARQEEEQRKKKIEEEALRKKIEEERKKKIEEDILRKKVEEELRSKENLRSKKEEEEIRRRLEEARRRTSPAKSKHHTEADGAKVFIIDDDEKLLNILESTISEEGYTVFAFSTSDDAYQALKDATPDLILSDINLETSTMGGFSFYEKVRELDHLQEVPFVFLSGLSDEVLVRTGKELGVDDYVTKPFSEKHLLAVVKGKIKRYQQLKARREKS